MNQPADIEAGRPDSESETTCQAFNDAVTSLMDMLGISDATPVTVTGSLGLIALDFDDNDGYTGIAADDDGHAFTLTDDAFLLGNLRMDLDDAKASIHKWKTRASRRRAAIRHWKAEAKQWESEAMACRGKLDEVRHFVVNLPHALSEAPSGRCAICGRAYNLYGNNSEPLDLADARVCDACNQLYVIPARSMNRAATLPTVSE